MPRCLASPERKAKYDTKSRALVCYRVRLHGRHGSVRRAGNAKRSDKRKRSDDSGTATRRTEEGRTEEGSAKGRGKGRGASTEVRRSATRGQRETARRSEARDKTEVAGTAALV